MAEKARRRSKKTTAAPEEQKELFPLARRVLLAGLGAAALAHDEARAFVDRLVERGELAQDQARELLEEIAQRREGHFGEMRGRVRQRMAHALETLDVPRRSDLEALQKRLDRLTERVEALLKQREGQG